MSTPSIQTLITQAQQVLNLKSSNEIRATLAAILANANVGTPLNPNLTTQQLWDEFYEIVRQPSDDIMSIITDQMMRMVFSPPAPGGAGADKQVIFNDMGVLAGDAGLVYNKTTDALTVTGLVTAGSATITGALVVDTTTLVANAAGYTDKVGVGTATPAATLHVKGSGRVDADYNLFDFYKDNGSTRLGYLLLRDDGPNYINVNSNQPLYITTNNTPQVQVETSGDVKIVTGNVVMGTSGKGIDFAAKTPDGSGTVGSEVLNDYEEGTFTPTVGASSGTGFTVTINSAIYTKIGRAVTVIFDFSIVAVGSATGAFQFSLPFNQSASSVSCGAFRENGTTGNMGQVFYNTAADVSCFLYNNVTVWNNGYRLRGTYTYSV